MCESAANTGVLQYELWLLSSYELESKALVKLARKRAPRDHQILEAQKKSLYRALDSYREKIDL